MYKDLNPTFTVHPDTGDITVRTGKSAINGSLTNLILSTQYDRPYNSVPGGGIYRLLFEPASKLYADTIKTHVEYVISNSEKRAFDVAVSVSVNNTGGGYIVNVVYTDSTTGKQNTLTTELTTR